MHPPFALGLMLRVPATLIPASSITNAFVVTIRAMGRHWRRAPREYDFSIPLPRPQVLGYVLLVLLAACAFATAALALLRTS